MREMRTQKDTGSCEKNYEIPQTSEMNIKRWNNSELPSDIVP
jgi:hypothetical protein